MSFVLRTTSIALAIGAAVGLSTLPASALTCDAVQITGIDGMSVGPISADACAGPFDGNDTGNSPQTLNLLERIGDDSLFGGQLDHTQSFEIFGKSDAAGSGVVADNGAITGDFSVDFGMPVTSFVLGLAGGSDYAAFLFEGLEPGEVFTGNFSTVLAMLSAGQSDQTPGLSHLTAVIVENGDSTVIPLPASLPLLVGGLAGLGLLGWRRKAA